MAEQTTRWAAELEAALAIEYAALWGDVYNDETRARLGADDARADMPAILRAITRAGLTLNWSKHDR